MPRREYEAWAQLSADGRHVLILASETDREEAMASTRGPVMVERRSSSSGTQPTTIFGLT